MKSNFSRTFITVSILTVIVLFQNCSNKSFQVRTPNTVELISQETAHLPIENFGDVSLPGENEVDNSSDNQTESPVPKIEEPIFLGNSTSSTGKIYYVAVTGNDSNVGSSTNPWRNPQKCAQPPIKAGDTCIVRDGAYIDHDGNGIVVYIRSTAPVGTKTLPITIKSERLYGATISIRDSGTGVSNTGFHINAPYYIIQGFNIDGSSAKAQKNNAGINIKSSGTVIRQNKIHHIGRSTCNNVHVNGNVAHVNAGLLISNQSNILVENNVFYSIGRRYNGELGCVTSIYHHDHGLYASGSNLTIRRNVFYDTNRGYPIHIYGGTATNLMIYHNTISGKNPLGKINGQIRLASTINGAKVMNNISHDSGTGFINAYPLKATNVLIYNNLSDAIINAWQKSLTGVQFQNNIEKSKSINFVDANTRNFNLKSTSAAINRGSTSGVPAVKDGRPDIGAFEY